MPAKHMPPASVSPYSCLGCREAKRKCDRLHPECTLCTQKNIPCSYPHRRKRRELRNSSEAASPAAGSSVASPESSLARRPVPVVSATAANLLAERFMDPELFAFAQLELPGLEVESLVTDDVEALVGDVQDIQATAQFFFETVHTWMPIVSKVGFSQSLIRRMTHQRAEFFLLVLSMKLCSSRVTNARTNLYRTARQLHADMERSGTLSLLVLQAGILIALYEMGHGLYPDAYLSVAQCARYGTALGVDKTIVSRDLAATKVPDLEEARRVWWSILVLDRFMNLCDPMRHLVTADPDSTSYLPIDDEEWDSGTSGAGNAFTLGSAISLRLGRFARFAQAAHLLSQVLHQVADRSSDTTQLRRTIFSLVNVSRIEADMRHGILLLDHPTLLPPGHQQHGAGDLSSETSSILQAALNMSLHFSDAHMTRLCDFMSPFLLYLMYKVSAVCMKRSLGRDSESLDARNAQAVRLSLGYLSRRWLAAGEHGEREVTE
ncbi:Transcription factor [Metarhizium brunneum]|uniref:Transcription factor n=1 Tax=Metarhizium brunneum TaxID=500148 RepID=A0A7D5YZK2_9HYPO|nr:Transcription factor [Metarhizium brunneum]